MCTDLVEIPKSGGDQGPAGVAVVVVVGGSSEIVAIPPATPSVYGDACPQNSTGRAITVTE